MTILAENANSTAGNSCVRLSCSGERLILGACLGHLSNHASFSHPHWDRFPKITYGEHIVFGVSALCFGITAILGNFAVIWTFFRHRSLRSTANILIINLSLADLLMATLVVFMHSTSALTGRWLFGGAGCMVYAATCALAAFVSISSMTVIALERHLVITQKYALTRILSKTKAIRWCIGTWLYALVLSGTPFLGWGRYIPEGVETSCTFDFFSRDWNNLSFVLTISIVGFAIPLLIICVCYMGIVIAVSNHESEIRKTGVVLYVSEPRRSTQLRSTKTDVRTAKIIFSTVTLFCISWMPYSIIAFIGSFGNACAITPLMSAIPGMLAKAATMLNPLVYALCHQRFKRNMKQLFRCSAHRSAQRQQSVLEHKASSNNDTDASKDLCRRIKTKLSFRSWEGRKSSQTTHDTTPTLIARNRWIRPHNFASHGCKTV